MGNQLSLPVLLVAFMPVCLVLVDNLCMVEGFQSSEKTCYSDATTDNEQCGTCQLQTTVKRIFDPLECVITNEFTSMMDHHVKTYGSDRKLVMLMMDGFTGAGKSMLSSFVLGCPNVFPSQCSANGVTKGVWTHDIPLTCCGLAYLHKLPTDQCPCECKGDFRDLDPSTNQCPLMLLLDAEGFGANEAECSFAPFYLFSQAHVMVLRGERTPIKLIVDSALTHIAQFEDALGITAGAVESATKDGHQLHYINIATLQESILQSLESCPGCTKLDLPKRDELYRFFGRNNIKEQRTVPTFEPIGIENEILVDPATWACWKDGELLKRGIDKLFLDHISPQFRANIGQYLTENVLGLSGLKLKELTGTNEPMKIGDIQHMLPVMVSRSVQQEQGCPVGTLSCAIQAGKCMKVLTSEELQTIASTHTDAYIHSIKSSASSLDSQYLILYGRETLREALLGADGVRDHCLIGDTSNKLISPAEIAISGMIDDFAAKLNTNNKDLIHNRDKQLSLLKPLSQVSGIFHGTQLTPSDEANIMKKSLLSVTSTTPHTEFGARVFTGYLLEIDSTLALGSNTAHAVDIIIRVHELKVPSGEWVIYAPGRRVLIEANHLDLQGSLTIDVSGRDAKDLYGGHRANSGVNLGDHGANGGNGVNGDSAGTIDIKVVNTKRHGGKIVLKGNGGKGSGGQHGGNGLRGRDGNPGEDKGGCSKNHPWNHRGGNGERGQNGGNGGHGGRGGDGGNAGLVSFKTNLFADEKKPSIKTNKEAIEESVLQSSVGGPGGSGGQHGDGAAEGKGGREGHGQYKKCKWHGGGCHCVGGNNGHRGGDGSRGHNGNDGTVGNAGKNGQIIQHINSNAISCQEMSVIGINSAVQYGRMLMLEGSIPQAKSVLEKVETQLSSCSDVDNPTLQSFHIDSLILLDKLTKGQNIFGFIHNSLPALGPSVWLDTAENMINSLIITENTRSDLSKHAFAQNQMVTSLKNMKESLTTAATKNQAKYHEWHSTLSQYTSQLEANSHDLIAAQRKALDKLEGLSNAIQQETLAEARRNKPSLLDSALKTLGKVATIAGRVASVANFVTTIPTVLDNLHPETWTNKLKSISLKKGLLGMPTDWKDVLLLPKRVVRETQRIEDQASKATSKFESFMSNFDPLNEEKIKIMNNDISSASSSQLIAFESSDIENTISSRLSMISSDEVANHPNVQHMLKESITAYSNLLNILSTRSQLAIKRDEALLSLQQIVMNEIQLERMMALANSNLAIATIHYEQANYVNWLVAQTSNTLMEMSLYSLDNSIRALSGVYLKSIVLSSNFINVMKAVTVASSSDIQKQLSTLSSAMKLQINELRTMKTFAKDEAGREPTRIKGLKWEFPNWAVKQLLENENNKVTLNLLWDHPDWMNNYQIAVSHISIFGMSSECTIDKVMFGQVKVKSIGDCTTRDKYGELWFHQSPIREWTKNIIFTNDKIDYHNAHSMNTPHSSDLGLGPEFIQLSPFSHWEFQVKMGNEQDSNKVKTCVDKIVVVFDGTAY